MGILAALAARSHVNRGSTVENRLNPTIARRDLFRVAAIAAAVATASACASVEAAEFPDKRKARYQADSANVQSFYRVNRYPTK
jgi:hypothetical protein